MIIELITLMVLDLTLGDENGFNWWPEGNYHNKGDLWERDIHITYFENTAEIVFETDAGMRMRGNSSAANPQKSFNVYFRKEYGMSNIEYPIFNILCST